jgi:hypothetical protein
MAESGAFAKKTNSIGCISKILRFCSKNSRRLIFV